MGKIYLLALLYLLCYPLEAQQIVPGTWSYRTGPDGAVSDPLVQGISNYKVMANFDTSPYKEFSLHSGTGSPDSTSFLLNFRLLEPKGYNPGVDKKYPIIIMLHGLGEGGIKGTAGYDAYEKTDLRYWNNDHNLFNGGRQHYEAAYVNDPSSPYYFPGFVMAPQANIQWDNRDQNSVITLIDLLLTKYKIDPNRIYIHGYSNGGSGVWEIAQKRPDLIAAMIVISWVDEDMDASRLVHIPLWQFQGELDTGPYASRARKDQEKLKDAGATPLYTEYENAGHGIWDKAYAEENFFPFLLGKNKTDIHPYFGKTTVCLGDEVNIRLGVSPGFKAYQWKYFANDKETVLPAGTDNNEYVATQTGDYFVRFSRVANPGSGDWTEWSKPLTITVQQADESPEITVLGSTALPGLDGKNTVDLMVPTGDASYQWYRNGEVLNGSQYYSNRITVGQGGSYTVSVTEVDECEALESPAVVVTVNASTTAVASPTNLSAKAVSENEIDLTWTDNADNEKFYEVYRSKGSNKSYVYLTRLASGRTEYADSTLQSDVKYYYIIRGINDQGSSKKSNEASATTLSDKQPPTIPGYLYNEMLAPDRVKLIWGGSKDNQGTVTYDIYVNGTRRFTTSDTTYIWSGLTKDKSYLVYVKARDGSGNVSEASNQVTVYSVFSGLAYRYYYGGLWDKVADYSDWQVEKEGYVDTFTIERESDGGVRPDPQSNYFAFDFDGYLYIKKGGNYEFSLRAAAGSILTIDGSVVVNNDGNHEDQLVTGARTLTTGPHAIKVQYYDRVQDEILEVAYKGADTDGQMILLPEDALTSSGTTFDNPPEAPDSIRITGINKNSITLKWADRSSNETGFELLRSKNEDGPFQKVATTGKNMEEWTDKGLSAHTTYFYALRAVGKSGESDRVTLQGTTNIDLALFEASCFSGRITLHWKEKTPNTHSILVERSLNDSTYIVIGRITHDSISADTLQWRDNVSPAGPKMYRLRQKNAQGYDGVSENVSVECEDTSNEFMVDLYPVPVDEGRLYVAIHAKSTVNPVQIRILDSTGRVYLDKQVDGQEVLAPLELDLSYFERKGLYIVQVRQGHYATAKRFVIE